MSSKGIVIICILIFGVVVCLNACDQGESTTTPPVEPAPIPTPTLAEPAVWVPVENWWLEPQVWLQMHNVPRFTDIAYKKAGVSVAAWVQTHRRNVEKMHELGWYVVGASSMITTYSPGPLQNAMVSEASPELEEAAIMDPYGNLFYAGAQYGLELVGLSDKILVHSTLHPVWQAHMLQRMKDYIDIGVDGYMVDEVAYGSIWFPDFNPNTMALFREYLLETYTQEELAAMGKPWGITDFTDFDYAALVREYMPEDETPLTEETWNNDWLWSGRLPMANVFLRFLHVKNQEFARWILQEGQAYALETTGKYLPVSANLNDLSFRESVAFIDALDFVLLEYPYVLKGYFPTARTTGALKLAKYFNVPGIVLTDMNTRGEKRFLPKNQTVNLYRTMIADATANGGAFHVEHLAHDIQQDMDALAPYYRFVVDQPTLFADLEPLKGQIGVLHLWESFSYYGWPDPYLGICELLADSGYQFGIVFGSEEFLNWGEEPIQPAPDHPLDPAELAEYPVVILPELSQLTPNHAAILLDYVENGGTLVIFSNPDTVWDLNSGDPLVGQILSARDQGTLEIGAGKLIHIDGTWGADYIGNPDPFARTRLVELLEGVGVRPEVRMGDTRYLGATAYTSPGRMVVHFVNYDHNEATDTTTPTGPIEVEITLLDGFQLDDPALYLFTPGELPKELQGELNRDILTFTLPDVYIWSVVMIGEDNLVGQVIAELPPTPTPIPPPTPAPTYSVEEYERGYVIFDDEKRKGWTRGVFGGESGLSDIAYAGETSLEVTLDPNGVLIFETLDPPRMSQYDWLVFYFNGGDTADQQLYVQMIDDEMRTLGEKAYFSDYIEETPLQPGQWYKVAIPLRVINQQDLSFRKFEIGDASGLGASTFYIDDISFVAVGQ